MELIGQFFTTTIYASVVGKILIENEVLTDSSVATSLFVQYPDGFSEEIGTVQEGFEKLEL